jgi:hypothetical protein
MHFGMNAGVLPRRGRSTLARLHGRLPVVPEMAPKHLIGGCRIPRFPAIIIAEKTNSFTASS